MQAPGTVPPATTSRHLGDTLWPWFLGAVALGGLALLVWKLTSGKKRPPQLDAEGEEGSEADPPGGVGKFKAALPVRLKYPPMGYKRRTRARALSERDYTANDGGRYNLEVED